MSVHFRVLITLSAFLVPTALRAEVLFRLGTVVAAPGQTEVQVPLSIEVPLDAAEVASWSAVVLYEPTVLTSLTIEDERGTPDFRWTPSSEVVEPGVIALQASYAPSWPAAPIAPGTTATVARLRFCVLPTAVPGEYPIHIAPSSSSSRKRWDDGYVQWTGFSPGYGDARMPATEAGLLTVAGPVVPGSSCPPDEHLPPPLEQPEFVRFELVLPAGRAAANPLDIVEAYLVVHSEAPVSGFQAALGFDGGVFEFLDVDTVATTVFGSIEVNSIVSGGVDAVGIEVAAGFHSDNDALLPAGTNGLATLRFRVRPDNGASNGEIFFEDRMPRSRTASGIAFRNLVAVEHGFVIPDLRGVTVPLGRPFRRGDFDGSGTLDLTDAVRALGFLFLAGERPSCLDAADANDDGALDLSDPIRLLQLLFLGGSPLPPPGGVPGLDPTPDDLGC